jgi:hypothetical protein
LSGIWIPAARDSGGPLNENQATQLLTIGAWRLALLGHYDEAIAEMKKAESLDPLSLITNSDLAGILVLSHSYDESI